MDDTHIVRRETSLGWHEAKPSETDHFAALHGLRRAGKQYRIEGINLSIEEGCHLVAVNAVLEITIAFDTTKEEE